MKCKTCKYWSGGISWSDAPCRRYPPQVVVEQRFFDGFACVERWPEMHENDWCGEYREKGDG